MRTRKLISGSYRNDTPLLRMMIPFIVGILFQLNFEPPVNVFFIGLMCLVVFLTGHTLIRTTKAFWKIRWMTGLTFQGIFLLSGMVLTSLHTEINDPLHFSVFHEKQPVYFARLVNTVSEKPASYKTTAEVFAIQNNKTAIKVKGKVLVYFKKDSLAAALEYGDRFCFTSPPAKVEGPKNPGEFDYKQFLAYHQVYHQVYLRGKDWKILPENTGNPVIRLAFRAREFFCKILREQISEKRAFAVASALVIGYVDEVDKELINAYASAGVLHVLSVSGMHVGLIYQGLFILLGFMNKNKWGRHLFHIFLLSFIWFYAFLTGFSPSVARSAVMLSVVLLGRWFDGSTNVFNTLVVSAFGLLIYNPFYITDVGFQLSFLAVWGIVYFHPKIFQLLEPSNRLGHWVWEITSISLSAQVTTFPLGLLYFHQFPNLFMFANLVVIPLSGIVIYACLAVLAFSPIAIVSSVLSKVTVFLLDILNQTVLFIEQVPGSVISRIYITGFDTLVIYAILIGTTLYLIYKRPLYLFSCLVALILFVTAQLVDKFEKMNQKQIVVYHVPGKQAMDFITGHEHIFVSDSLLPENKPVMLFHIFQNWWNLGLKQDLYLNTNSSMQGCGNNFVEYGLQNHFICFAGKKIVLADKKFVNSVHYLGMTGFPKFKIDYLILSDNSVKHLKDFVSVFDCKEIIIDASNSKYWAERWTKEARNLNIKCYSVLDKGAFIEKIR